MLECVVIQSDPSDYPDLLMQSGAVPNHGRSSVVLPNAAIDIIRLDGPGRADSPSHDQALKHRF